MSNFIGAHPDDPWQLNLARRLSRGRRPSSTTINPSIFPATLAHVDRLIAAGVHGLIMLGTVGENCSLESSEKLELLRTTVEHVAGRVPVLTGVAEYTTALACRFAADAAADRRRRPDGPAGDGLQVRSARDDGPLPRRRPGHAICRSSSYNNPVVLRRRHHAGDVRRPGRRAELRRHQGIVGKRAAHHRSEEPAAATAIVLFCGVDDLVLESVLLGAIGWVSGLVNAFPGGESAAVGPGHQPAARRRPCASTAGTRRCCISTRM